MIFHGLFQLVTSVDNLMLIIYPFGKIMRERFLKCQARLIWSPFQIISCIHYLQVVALVCNFSSSNDRSNVRLNHSEVETLFHEFGHALHSLLSRTVFGALHSLEQTNFNSRPPQVSFVLYN